MATEKKYTQPPWINLERRVKKNPDDIPPSTSSPSPPWIELPPELTANILHRLGAIEILMTAQKVCTTWRSACKDPLMWRVIDIKRPLSFYNILYLDTMYRHAVDRSQGQLIDISLEYFGTDDLLQYISHRSSQLRRLRLACCDQISGQGINEAAQKLPHLEELHLFFIPATSGRDMEAIGRSCPMLKSFTYNNSRVLAIEQDDEHAFAIAGNMPGLRHLRLYGNRMTNEGLKAILVAGCPHLESLDIQKCSNVDLGDESHEARSLAKRCSHQIRDLRGPSDPYSSEYADLYEYEYDEYFSIIHSTNIRSMLPLHLIRSGLI